MAHSTKAGARRIRCITGVPVVDENNCVLGVVSQTDLVRARREGPLTGSRLYV